jgi:hypothetical protein
MPREYERAERGSEEMPGAPQYHSQDQLRGKQPMQLLWRDLAHQLAIETAGEAYESSGKDECAPSVLPDRDAYRGRPHFVVSDRPEGLPERRRADPPQHEG